MDGTASTQESNEKMKSKLSDLHSFNSGERAILSTRRAKLEKEKTSTEVSMRTEFNKRLRFRAEQIEDQIQRLHKISKANLSINGGENELERELQRILWLVERNRSTLDDLLAGPENPKSWGFGHFSDGRAGNLAVEILADSSLLLELTEGLQETLQKDNNLSHSELAVLLASGS